MQAKDHETMWIEAFGLLDAGLNGTDGPMKPVRAAAIEQFRKLGLPRRKDEEWKYTNIPAFLKDTFRPGLQTAPAVLTAADIRQIPFPSIKSNRMVFVNGDYSPEHSEILEPEKFHQAEGLAGTMASRATEVAAAAGRLSNLYNDPFVHLNTAFIHDGAYVRVRENETLEFPLYLIHVHAGSKESRLIQPRHLIWMTEGSKARILTLDVNLDPTMAQMTNVVNQIWVEDGAGLEWYCIQEKSGNDIHLAHTEISLGPESAVSTHVITLDGRLNRNSLAVTLNGRGGKAKLFGLYNLGGSSHTDNRTLIDHVAEDCMSDELYKGILDEQASGVFNGKVIVRPGAQRTNAFQHNPNILLSDDAVINTKPQLEIFADDVKCSHGATIGSLDENALFYLRSRGLGQDDAKNLLVYAFANEVLETIGIPGLRNALSGLLESRILKG